MLDKGLTKRLFNSVMSFPKISISRNKSSHNICTLSSLKISSMPARLIPVTIDFSVSGLRR